MGRCYEDLISVCKVREGDRCKNCVYNKECDAFMKKHDMHKPKDFIYVVEGKHRKLILINDHH